MIQLINKELGINQVLTCPNCESNDLEMLDLGDDEDSDGRYGNWRIVCNHCGRHTLDMNSFEDAWYAFNHDDDTVIQPQ